MGKNALASIDSYCHQWFRCECGHRENIWNSADADAPGVADCPSCGEHTLKRTDFHLDRRMNEFEPFPGKRYWRQIDDIETHAKSIVRARHGQLRGRQSEVDREIKRLSAAPPMELIVHGYERAEQAAADDQAE